MIGIWCCVWRGFSDQCVPKTCWWLLLSCLLDVVHNLSGLAGGSNSEASKNDLAMLKLCKGFKVLQPQHGPESLLENQMKGSKMIVSHVGTISLLSSGISVYSAQATIYSHQKLQSHTVLYLPYLHHYPPLMTGYQVRKQKKTKCQNKAQPFETPVRSMMPANGTLGRHTM